MIATIDSIIYAMHASKVVGRMLITINIILVLKSIHLSGSAYSNLHIG